jgi:glyoxylase-like metal-dependent hydrolase (beta-lactamase superfamily II)
MSLAVDSEMHVTKLQEHVSMIDLETGGLENFIASYVLKGKEVAVIETGPALSVPNLLHGLKKLSVKLEEVSYVAVSHIHLDHGGGVGTLLKYLPNARVIVHHRGAPHLASPEKLWQQSRMVLGKLADFYGQPEPVPMDRIIATADNMTFDVGNDVSFRVVETLGHASHHQSYFENLGGAIFVGDAAGIYLKQFDSVVPTTPAPFHLESALYSLDRLTALKPKALYYSHFGPAAEPERKLQAYASQLKLWARITAEGTELGQSIEEIRDRIANADMSFQKAEELIKIHPILSETVLDNSVQGFIDLAEKAHGKKG